MLTKRWQQLERVLPALLVLLAFGVRLYASDTGWVFRDQTHLRSEGIMVLDDMAAGRWSSLPIFTYRSSSGLFNPGLMVYVWALIAAIDRAQLIATMANLMLDALTVPMLFALARNFLKRSNAIFAMTLIAVSPWAVGVARGTWQPGQLAFCFVLVAWLLITGLVRERPRWIIAGFVAAAVTMWTYTLAFAVVAQAVLASLILFKRTLARPVFAGWAICAASLSLMLFLALASGEIGGVSVFVGWATTAQPAEKVLPQTVGPLEFALQIGTWSNYVKAWVDPSMPFWRLAEGFNQVWSWLVTVLAAIGLLMAGVSAIRRRAFRGIGLALIAWFLLPVAAFTAMTMSTGGYAVQLYYLMLTAPAVYLLPAYALQAIENGANSPFVSRFVRVAGVVCALAAAPFAIWTAVTAAQSAYAQGYVGTLSYMPVWEFDRLGAHLRRSGCDAVHTTRPVDDSYWVAAIWQRSAVIRDERTSALSAESSVWEITPGQKNCLMFEEAYALPGTAVEAYTFANGKAAYLYSAQSASATMLTGKLSSNIGWTLLELDTPVRAGAGQPVTVTHTWSVRELPAEEFWSWYFAPNIKLTTPAGTVIGEYWGKSISGNAWRLGDEIRSTLAFQVPPDTAPGDYVLKVSPFDPNQKKNAVYFSASRPGEPIVIIERAIRITERGY